MQSNEITLFNKLGLIRSSDFNYSESVNAFLGNAFTSMAGNTYLNEIRFLEGLVIKEDIGHGYAHTFVNGIRIFDIRSKKLICERLYHCTYYSTIFLRSEVRKMLIDFLLTSTRKEGITIDYNDAVRHIAMIVDKAFNTDQRHMLEMQSKKFLT